MNKRLILFTCGLVWMSFVFSGCSSNEKSSDLKTKNKVEKSMDTKDIEENKDLSFEEANIFSNELINRDDDSFTEIIADFKIVNNGSENIDYFSGNFVYYDENGNQICKDGRYHDCQIKPGKAAYVTTYSSLNGRDKADIANIELTSYQYTIGDKQYSVNLQTKEINQINLNYDLANIDFEKANILNFSINAIGLNIINAYEVDVKINNDGQVPIKYCSYRMEYYNSDGDSLTSDGRYSDSVLNPGNYSQSQSFCDEKFSSQVSSAEVYSYEYDLVDVDENGFNHYEVNLQTKTAIGNKVD